MGRRGWMTLLAWVGPAACAGCVSPAAPVPAVPAAAAVPAAVPAAAAPPTLWDFLGVTPLCNKIAADAQTKVAWLAQHFPCLEPKPPLLPLTDPANLASPVPAVAVAAKVAAEEAMAPQKIKALDYLATVGCGCHEGVNDAFLAALDDCSEPVRFAAAKGLYFAANNPCKVCRSSSCCSPKIREKLHQMGFEPGDNCCAFEPSPRVRRMARLALSRCGSLTTPPFPPPPEQLPIEGPLETVPPAGPVVPLPVEPEAVPPASVATKRSAGGSSVQPTIAQATPPAPAAPEEANENAGSAKLADAPVPESAEETVIRQAAARASDEVVLARVNGEPITSRDLAGSTRERRAAASAAEAASPRFWNELRGQLQQTINQELLRQEAHDAQFAADGNNRAAIARAWLDHQVPINETVTADELAEFYRAHADRFVSPAAIRWERVTARIASFDSRDKALQAIEYVHQRALGSSERPPEDVDVRLIRNEDFGWTGREQLGSSAVAEALFALPVGRVSDVLEDDANFYLVRVLERRAEHPQPLEQVADTIRGEILRSRRQSAERQYVQELRARAEVWTIFDGTDAAATRTVSDERTATPVPPQP